MPRARRILILALGLALLAPGALPAHADEVEDLLALIKNKPPGMERDAWKEKRREAARKLGELGDPRAVPVLVDVVESERFDVISEIAVEALGKIGDERAAPALRRVADDASRDRYVRQAARKALRRIGVSVEGGEGDEGGGGGETGGGDVIELGGAAGLASTRVEVPEGPTFSEDTLGATERVTFAAGGARLSYDTVREIAALEGDISGAYERKIDKERSAYRYGGQVDLVGGAIDQPNEGGEGVNSSSLIFSTTVDGEARFYLSGRPVYGLVQGAVVGSYTGVRVKRVGGDTSVSRLGADLHAAVGFGYGRILDHGAALRLKRIELALKEARALGRPITGDLAERIFSAWWALRGEQGAHRHLLVTIALLREAGVLLGQPDPSLTYKILQILLDGQLDRRPRGVDAHLGFAESFLVRDDELPMMSDVVDGRVETVVAAARYGHQAEDGETELVGEAFARYRVLAGDGDPSPWATGATVAWRRFFYNDYYDPLGALEIGGVLAASNQGQDDDDAAGRLGGRLGWIWFPNRASRFRLAADLTFEDEEIFLGVTFEALYGLLDVGYIGKTAY